MAKAKAAPKKSTTKKAATAAVVNPGSIAGIGGVVGMLGATFDPGRADTWAQVGGAVSALAVAAAAWFGARGERSGS